MDALRLPKRGHGIDPTTRPIPLRQISVVLRPGVNPDLFGAYYGLRRSKSSQSDIHVYDTESVGQAQQLARTLSRDSNVEFAEPVYLVPSYRAGFTPNDPYFKFDNPIGSPGQWNLVNAQNLGGAGIDLGVKPIWDQGYKGQAVKIVFVDDGIDYTHPDLAPNYVPGLSYDYERNDDDPAPVYSTDIHGDAVAGIAAGRGGNALGITGVAPNAGIVFARLNSGLFNSAQFGAAINLAGKQVKVRSFYLLPAAPWYGGSSFYINNAFSQAADNKGLQVAPAGNRRGTVLEDTARTPIYNTKDVIRVAAIGADGKYADYSSYGSSIFVSAPSSSAGQPGIVTTDRLGTAGLNGFTGDDAYTPNFGGTSAATASVAGILALAVQHRHTLTMGELRHALANSCDVVDPTNNNFASDKGWQPNAAGCKFNQNYGFGLINPVKLFAYLDTIGTYQSAGTKSVQLYPNIEIPDGVTGGTAGSVTRSLHFNASTEPVEEVKVILGVSTDRAGDMEVYITSPSGTKRRILARSASDDTSLDNYEWQQYVTNAFWGESQEGNW